MKQTRSFSENANPEPPFKIIIGFVACADQDQAAQNMQPDL